MAKKIRFKRSVKKIVGPLLAPLGYELMEFPEIFRTGAFRKNVFDDVFAFVAFETNPYAIAPLPRRFNVLLWRNSGERPRRGPGGGETGYENRIETSLGWFLWNVLGLREPPPECNVEPSTPWEVHMRDRRARISPEYREWEFIGLEELESQLEDAARKVVQYAIPWLEDPESKIPGPKERPPFND